MQDLIQNQQIIHPIAQAILIAAGILILALPRKYAIIPFFFAAVFIPIQQRILILDIDFYTLRLLVTVALMRVFIRGEYAGFRVNLLDTTIIAAQIVRMLAYSILWTTPQAFLTAMATAIDGIGLYLVLRFWIRNLDDILLTLKSFAILLLCLSPFIFHEYFTGENVFHIFGGDQFSWLREGQIRSRGPFRHTLTLGAFVTPFVGLFLYLYFLGKTEKIFAILGGGSVVIISLGTASSTSYASLILAFIFAGFWPLRHRIQYLWYGLLGSLALLQMYLYYFKNKPIWAVILINPFISSSNAEHRFHLFDQYIKRYDEWWLIGAKSTSHWWYWTYDQFNQFVWIGANGSIFELFLFITTLYLSYKIIVSNLHLFSADKTTQFFFWALGVALTTHMVSFWGISYFDQSGIGLMLLFAIIACTADLNYQISQNLFATLLHPQPDTRQLATDSR